jgi:hypothetical protein
MNGVGNYSYNWSNGESNAANLSLTGNTTYYVTVTDENNCSVVDSVFIGIENSQGILGSANDESITVRYDAASRSIELASAAFMTEVTVWDLAGSVLAQRFPESTMYSLRSEDFRGLVLVKTETRSQVKVVKLLLE